MDQIPNRDERFREAIRLGREAESSRDFLLNLLALRRENLLRELEDGEYDPNMAIAIQGARKELHFIERLIESAIYSGKQAAKEMCDELTS